MKKTHVLMTGAGAPGGPGVLRCLQSDATLFITVADRNINASGRFLNHGGSFWEIPDARDEHFIRKVLEFCLQNEVDVILPLVTLELFKFAAHKEIFRKNGIKIIVSDFEFLSIANDKSALFVHLHNQGVITPDFKIVSASDFTGLKNAFQDLGYPERPLVFKPSISNGSRGVRIVNSNIDKLDLLLNHKPNSLYMTYDEMLDTFLDVQFPELLVMEYLPGEEYTIDTINYNGITELIIPRLRTRTSGGISTEGKFVKNEEIINYSEKILSTMSLHGPIGLQVKKAIDGSFKILEINPRIQGTSVAALGIGVNLALMAINQEIGKKTSFDKDSIAWGTHFVRYWQEIFF
jgi:carbamoyl-phosphate synthase large subunit